MNRDPGSLLARPGTSAPLVHRALYGVLGLGLVGMGVELLLLEHTEDVWQLVPLALIILSLLALVWRSVDRGASSLLAFRVVMTLSIVSGLVGTWLHYQGNVEFELEMTPGLGGFELFVAAMMGATPALAPGAMALLGLVGLVAELRAASTRTEQSQ